MKICKVIHCVSVSEYLIFFSNKLNPQHFYNKDIKYLFCLCLET